MSERKENIELLYKIMNITQREIEAELDTLADKGNTPEFESNLLAISELSIKLLKSSLNHTCKNLPV